MSNIVIEGAEEVNGVVVVRVSSDGSMTTSPAPDADLAPTPTGGGAQSGYEFITVADTELSVTLGQSNLDLGGNGLAVVLPDHTVSGKVKTIFNESPSWNAQINLEFVSLGVDSVNGYVVLPSRGSVTLEWDGEIGRWIFKNVVGNATTNVLIEHGEV